MPAHPPRLLVAVTAGALLSSGCSTLSTHLHETRLPFAGSDDLQIHCGLYPVEVEAMNRRLAEAYKAGWRLAAVGEQVQATTFLPAVRTPVLCLERRVPGPPSRRVPVEDEDLLLEPN